MKTLARASKDHFERLLRTFPAVLLYGPRQCGKTTLVQSLFPKWHHVDLERPADLGAITADLEGFFDAYPRHVVIDEAQRLPELFPVLRHVIDRTGQKGRFILLGSASPTLVRSVSETLAGRIGHMELTPFRSCELRDPHALRDRWFWGGFPPVHALRGARARGDWLDSYVATYLERDLPTMGLRLSSVRLRTLWTMLTHVHGSLLNVSDLARSLDVSMHTVNHHLDVLESTFMVRRLHPFYANVQKRLTKSSKLYVRDTGLLHFLAGLREPKELETWSKRGSSFEGLVIEELAALAADRLTRPELFFWRTQAGAEVDLLIVNGRDILPIEVKLGAAVNQYTVAGLRQCMKDLSLKRGWVICSAKERRTIGTNIEIIPWMDVARGQVEFF